MDASARIIDAYGRLSVRNGAIVARDGAVAMLRGMSLFHLWTIPLLVWLVRRVGFDARGWKLQTALAAVLFPVGQQVGTFDQNVVSYLELLRLPYTGCNPRGMLLARDKALSKKLLHYHRIPVPEFAVVLRGRKPRLPKRLTLPVIVKSLTQEASIGISQASVVDDIGKLNERVKFIHESIGTDAILEQYIEGRELYCGIIGNLRLSVLPVWQMTFAKMPDGQHRIATERVKWSAKYQEKVGIDTGEAEDLPKGMAEAVQHMSRRAFRVLEQSGYARIDLRLDGSGRVYVIEANPNPYLASSAEFIRGARASGRTYAQTILEIVDLARARYAAARPAR